MSHIDYIYESEDYVKNPKDQFKRILKWLEKNTDTNQDYRLLDLGCARGELIHFLKFQHKPLIHQQCRLVMYAS